MGDPNSIGKAGQGLPKDIAFDDGLRAGIEGVLLENQIMEGLKVPVQAGDNKAAQARFKNVRDLLDKMSPEHAGELLDQLNAKNSKDPLAKEIKYRFSDASVEKLKHDLAVKSGRAIDSPTPDTKPGKTSGQTQIDKQQRKGMNEPRYREKASMHSIEH